MIAGAGFLARPSKRRAYVVACGRMVLTRGGFWSHEPGFEAATFETENDAWNAVQDVLGALLNTDGLQPEVLPAEVDLLIHFATSPAGWVK